MGGFRAAKYPDHGNLTTLLYSAHSAIERHNGWHRSRADALL
jgi:hypothetical protein